MSCCTLKPILALNYSYDIHYNHYLYTSFPTFDPYLYPFYCRGYNISTQGSLASAQSEYKDRIFLSARSIGAARDMPDIYLQKAVSRVYPSKIKVDNTTYREVNELRPGPSRPLILRSACYLSTSRVECQLLGVNERDASWKLTSAFEPRHADTYQSCMRLASKMFTTT